MRDTGVEVPNLLETCMLDSGQLSEISSEELACCRRSEELATGSKLPSNLPQLKSGLSENLNYVRLSFVTSLSSFDVQLFD